MNLCALVAGATEGFDDRAVRNSADAGFPKLECVEHDRACEDANDSQGGQTHT